jgi:hypothetical protein
MRALMSIATVAAVLLDAPLVQACKQYHTKFGAGLRWSSCSVGYWVSEAGSTDVPLDAAVDEIEAGFDVWNAVSCLPLEMTYDGLVEDAGSYVGDKGKALERNVVTWISTEEQYAVWVAKWGAGTLGMTTLVFNQVTGEIVGADMEINDYEFTFTTSKQEGAVVMDLRNTICHEVGHVLGLDHSDVPDSTMYYKAPEGELSKCTLHDDDFKCVCLAYCGTECGGDKEAMACPSDTSDTAPDGVPPDEIGSDAPGNGGEGDGAGGCLCSLGSPRRGWAGPLSLMLPAMLSLRAIGRGPRRPARFRPR